jgi:predicted metal-dependent phosphoesterase TrpH
LIDLHTHTTASDGRCTPEELVARASAAGVLVLSVTDHDTTAGCKAAAIACAGRGIDFVPGIEITAVVEGADVHILGYFIDQDEAGLQAFLANQRRTRIDRVRQMIDRLASCGIRLDADAILKPAADEASKSAGRPWIARALVAGGYVADSNEAFSVWLQRGRPAFVPRTGPSPDEVFARIHEAGGVASLAHPVLVGHDEWIPGFITSGLDALEAYHSDHDTVVTGRYVAMAGRLGLAMSGGSDYHADPSHGARRPGSVSLPRAAFEALKARRR